MVAFDDCVVCHMYLEKDTYSQSAVARKALAVQKLNKEDTNTLNGGLEMSVNKNYITRRGIQDDGIVTFVEHGKSVRLPEKNKNPLLSSQDNVTDNIMYPITPQEALQLYEDKLTPFEREEILNYPKIWFLGLAGDTMNGAKYSGSYRDKRGFSSKAIGEHIAYRYEIVKYMGSGVYGQVFTCRDHMTTDLVAVKLNRNFDTFKTKAWQEVTTMDLLTKKDKNNQYNIVHMLDHFTFRSHLCIVMELMGHSLDTMRPVSRAVLPVYAASLFQALSLLHSEGLIHQDIKVLNILLDRENKFKVKLSDFGEACYQKDCQPSYNVQTHYKAPETFLGMPQTTAIDMWGLGIVILELYLQRREPLIVGDDDQQRMAIMIKLFGKPPKSMLDPLTAPDAQHYFDADGTPSMNLTSIMQRLEHNNATIPLFNSVDPLFRNFIKKCLVWEPNLRITPDEALQHPWIQASETEISQ